MVGTPDWVLILILTVLSVLFIVTDYRTATEKSLRQRFGIDRDWWVPPIAFMFAFALALVDIDLVIRVVEEKFDIIVLIFSFGIMSEGLGESGFFKYLAYKIVGICEGNTTRLVLYLFTMTSATTLFTTNDIVVLVLTPVIVEIAFQAGIKNTKPLLLSQFVAANTLSMGLLIGSPTNIIIAEELDVDFIQYFILMILPAVIAYFSSFVLIYWIMKISDREDPPVFGDLSIQSRYSMPHEIPEPYFTKQMRDWILIFATFVVFVAIVTTLRISLYWSAIPSMLIAVGYWYVSDEHTTPVREPVKRLPYGVFFFGMTFFIFADAFAQTGFVSQQLIPMLQEFFAGESVRASFAGVIGSGFLVNIFNDLPSAALVANILTELNFETFGTKFMLIQSSLVGLNIGTYVTQVGALAGLIWFNQLRIHRERQRDTFPELAGEMTFPSRRDLVRYGLAHFLFTGISAAMFLISLWVLLSFLIGPW
jgi:arsenical pump membrane protein